MASNPYLQWRNPRAYGARGDGSTDDTAAFGQARDAAGPAGQVGVPPGIYVLDGLNLNVAGQEWCLSPGATLLQKPSTAKILQVTAPGVVVGGYGTIDGNFARQTANAGADTVSVYSDHVTIRDITVQNANGYGIHAWGAVSHFTLRDARFAGTWNVALLCQSSGADITDISVTGCTVENANPALLGGGGAFTITGDSPYDGHLARRVVIANNRIGCWPQGATETGYSDVSAGVHLDFVSGFTVTGNVISGCCLPVTVPDCSDGTIAGNLITGWTLYAIELPGGTALTSGRIAVTGNTCTDTDPRAADGFHSYRCVSVGGAPVTGVVFSGNMFTKVSPQAEPMITIAGGSSDVAVTGNVLIRAAGAGGDLLDTGSPGTAISGNILDSSGATCNQAFINTDDGATRNITVTGNQFLGYGTGTAVTYGETAGLDYAAVTGNVFDAAAAGTGVAAGGTGTLGAHTIVSGNTGP